MVLNKEFPTGYYLIQGFGLLLTLNGRVYPVGIPDYSN